MASIMTGIQLQDNFSSVLYGIIDTVNIAVASMYDMSEAMSADVDTSSLQAAQDRIAQTTAALDRMNAAIETPHTPEIPTVPQPIVQWQSVNTDVFSNTGIERFQQEVQRVNSELEQLSDTQNTIAKQAYNTMIFPPEMAMDLNSLSVRMDTLKEKIHEIENNKVNIGTDVANEQLEHMHEQLSQMVQQQNNLNSAIDRMDVSAANTAYMQLQHSVSNTERFIRDNTNEQGRFNQEIRAGTAESNNLISSIKRMAAAYISVQAITQGVKFAMNASDELIQTTSRLNMMNDGVQTTQELLNMVYASAQDARGSFADMASVVARFGNNAKDAFGSSAEVVEFANLVQKQMTIAGASAQEAANAELQLSQALGSGVLRGDELNSIFEQAPNLIQNIADYLDVPIGKIREMASEGELSANVVKQAIFAASDDINAKFEAMPMTWGQLWQSAQNSALMAFQPVLQRMNEMANSEQFQAFVDGAIETMAVLANIVLDIFDLIGQVGGFIADNWSIISPIVYGVVAALAVYAIYLGIVKGIEVASAIASAAMAVGKGLLAAATMIATGATWAQVTAQMGLNGAMYACPIVWIIMLIIALVATIYLVVAAINKAAGTSVSATGIICGVFATAGAIIGNIFITLINFVIDIFCTLWNFIAIFANFFANVFNDPVGSIARLFFDLVDTILSLLETLASAIDTIFGSNLASAVSGWRDSLGSWVDNTFGQGEEIMAKVDSSAYHFDRLEYGSAFDAGYNFGEGIDEKISNFSLSDIFGKTDIPNPDDYLSAFNGSSAAGNLGDIAGNTGALDDIAGNTGNTAEDTARIADAVDITDEDLKYLRDIAEREIIDRTVFTKVEVNMGGVTNQVNNMSDLDDIADRLNGVLQEQIMISAEG